MLTSNRIESSSYPIASLYSSCHRARHCRRFHTARSLILCQRQASPLLQEVGEDSNASRMILRIKIEAIKSVLLSRIKERENDCWWDARRERQRDDSGEAGEPVAI